MFESYADGILSVIGNTPLVRLRKVIQDLHFELYGKLESLNPGGSTKDRPALTILKHAMDAGKIISDTVIIESSSGNMGIGLAQACSYYGLKFICVVDPKTTEQNIRLLKAYGAEVDLVEKPDPVTREYLQARLNRVRALCKSNANSFWPNQYSNTRNSAAHHQTMREIVTALDTELDYLFCATSTCGTLRGCAEYVRQEGLKTKVIAVDAIGSVIFGGANLKRLIPGHGAAVRPELYQDGLSDNCVLVSDLDCIIGCRRLVGREAIMAGGSSGAVLMAVDKMKDEIPKGAVCAAILADRGERYLDTIYSDEWVIEHFGDVACYWEDAQEVKSCMTMTF